MKPSGLPTTDILKPLEHIGIFGYSMQVCRMLILAMRDQRIFNYHAKKDQAYVDAEINMLIDDPANIEKYISGWHIRYRNHQRDKKGRLVKVEAYLIP